MIPDLALSRARRPFQNPHMTLITRFRYSLFTISIQKKLNLTNLLNVNLYK
jgi:hypothetical protein